MGRAGGGEKSNYLDKEGKRLFDNKVLTAT